MKKSILFSLILLCAVGIAAASPLADRPITAEQLPAAAQKFIKTHFSGSEFLYAKSDDGLFSREYKVVLAGGVSVEFAGDGEWKEVDTKYGEVPAAIVPEAIRKQVARQFSGARIENIERDRRGYDVGLSNGLDLKFDRRFNLVEIDD